MTHRLTKCWSAQSHVAHICWLNNATDPTGASDTSERSILESARLWLSRFGYHFHNLPATKAECFAAFFGYYAIRAGFGTASGGFSVPAGAFEMIYQQTWVWCGLLP